MESSTGLVTETNGVLDLAKVNIQKKTKKTMTDYSSFSHMMIGYVPFIYMDLTWRFIYFFLMIVTLDIHILQSVKWKNNCICGPYQNTRDPHRTHCSAWQHHHAHGILWVEKKNQTTRYAPHYGADHVQYIYEHILLLQLSPSCKINTALRDELSYRLKRWMNIQRSG